ncbi:MAG: hypothetical protein BMS9Abin02_1382 [Anaerolineae bacterium]|nr:MAG: hypothetical protein BMS9Abin02_1382 [Anaerolineae bacterium]
MVRRSLIYFVSFLLFAALACNLPGRSEEGLSEESVQSDTSEQGQKEASAPEDSSGGEVQSEEGEAEMEPDVQESSEEVSESIDASTADPALPIGMREGLASLNSFQSIMKIVNNGPTQGDRQESEITIRFSSEQDARHMHTESLSSSSESPEIYQSISDEYQIGLNTCTVSTSDGSTDVTTEEMTPLIKDMVNSTTNLFDITITAPNPTFVGAETLNGIETNHYTFKVIGLGDYSGDEVTQADGEYWVAQDGRFLVKYEMILEVRSGPEGDPDAAVMHSEYGYELTEINQPISISMPAECAAQESEQS